MQLNVGEIDIDLALSNGLVADSATDLSHVGLPRHSSIGLVPPVEFENEHYRRINPQRQPSPGELASH